MSSPSRQPRWYPALGKDATQAKADPDGAGAQEARGQAQPPASPLPAPVPVSGGPVSGSASVPPPATPVGESELAREIGKRRPFESPEQEAFLNILRTANFFATDFNHLFRQHGLTEATYNVLRILRGCKHDPEAPHGRTCSQVGEHMITQVPDVTRLVDRLEQMGLAERRRCQRDRRVVYVAITDRGMDVLANLDGPVLELHRAHLGHMASDELSMLSSLLAKARRSVADQPGPEPPRG
jgi:DNA-binding MarR family transcriptional regulator